MDTCIGHRSTHAHTDTRDTAVLTCGDMVTRAKEHVEDDREERGVQAIDGGYWSQQGKCHSCTKGGGHRGQAHLISQSVKSIYRQSTSQVCLCKPPSIQHGTQRPTPKSSYYSKWSVSVILYLSRLVNKNFSLRFSIVLSVGVWVKLFCTVFCNY